jgi:hypothetical protein
MKCNKGILRIKGCSEKWILEENQAKMGIERSKVAMLKQKEMRAGY